MIRRISRNEQFQSPNFQVSLLGFSWYLHCSALISSHDANFRVFFYVKNTAIEGILILWISLNFSNGQSKLGYLYCSFNLGLIFAEFMRAFSNVIVFWLVNVLAIRIQLLK